MSMIFAAIQAQSGDHSAIARLVANWNWTHRGRTSTLSATGLVWAAGRVVQFVWQQMGCAGSVNLTSLPTVMTVLDFSFNQFSGPLDLTRLPTGMTYLGLSYNQFRGPLPNLSSLPAGMIQLTLEDNDFCGSTGIDIPCVNVALDNNCTCGGSAVQWPAC